MIRKHLRIRSESVQSAQILMIYELDEFAMPMEQKRLSKTIMRPCVAGYEGTLCRYLDSSDEADLNSIAVS